MDLLSVLTFLVGLGVSILVAGIPWAYSIHGRLTKIETKITVAEEVRTQVRELEGELHEFENRMIVVESKLI